MTTLLTINTGDLKHILPIKDFLIITVKKLKRNVMLINVTSKVV